MIYNETQLDSVVNPPTAHQQQKLSYLSPSIHSLNIPIITTEGGGGGADMGIFEFAS